MKSESQIKKKYKQIGTHKTAVYCTTQADMQKILPVLFRAGLYQTAIHIPILLQAIYCFEIVSLSSTIQFFVQAHQ